MTRTALRAALAGSLVLLAVSGCRTTPPPAPAILGPGADAPWDTQYAQLAGLDRYALQGRVAVAANGQGFSANMRYRREAARSELALDGPMGVGGLRVTLEGERLVIVDSRGEQLDDARARAELEQKLGVALPIEALRWWLLGVPAPGPVERNQADNGEIRDFLQDGWRVSIQTRVPALGFALPQRLTAEREGARIKLLVESWQP